MPYDKARVGLRLKSLRVDRGMSQKDLAEKSGVSLNAIARYELGDMSMGLDKAYELTDAMGCTIDQLVCRDR